MKGYYIHPKEGFTGRAGIEFKAGKSVKVQDSDFVIRHTEMLGKGCKFIPLDEANPELMPAVKKPASQQEIKEPEKIDPDKLAICPVCGSEFEKRANNQKYCSQACKKANKRK